MNYCLIEDAWRVSNETRPVPSDYLSDQYNVGKKNIIENFINYDDNNEKNHCVFSCEDFWKHLDSCHICQNKVRNNYSSKLVERIQTGILNNKDTILLILIIIFLLVFFNLLISIFKK
jgi:hypothetical protein